MYKAIVTVNGKMSTVVEGATPAALGTAIGAAISADGLGSDVDVMFRVDGPISRRMAPAAEEPGTP